MKVCEHMMGPQNQKSQMLLQEPNTYQTQKHKMELDLKSKRPHAIFMRLDQVSAVLLSLFDDASRDKRDIKVFPQTERETFQYFWPGAYQASLTFLVSGQAQHGFRGFFFSSVPSVTAGISTLAAERDDILELQYRN